MVAKIAGFSTRAGRGAIVGIIPLFEAIALTTATTIHSKHATDKLRVDYAHVGLYDVEQRRIWIARKRLGVKPLNVSHARMLVGGSNTTSVGDKDRFLCYWFHTPNTGEGLVHGYPIEWAEAHLMIRLDPNWNYATQELIRSVDAARVEKNIEQQYQWGRYIFNTYVNLGPRFALSWHMIGPRPADSMFYIERHEPKI